MYLFVYVTVTTVCIITISIKADFVLFTASVDFLRVNLLQFAHNWKNCREYIVYDSYFYALHQMFALVSVVYFKQIGCLYAVHVRVVYGI